MLILITDRTRIPQHTFFRFRNTGTDCFLSSAVNIIDRILPIREHFMNSSEITTIGSSIFFL